MVRAVHPTASFPDLQESAVRSYLVRGRGRIGGVEFSSAMMRLTLSLAGNLDQTSVERAIAEFRAGRPVLIARDDGVVLAIGAEDLTADDCERLDAVAQGSARLVLPAARLRRLGLDRKVPGSVSLPTLDRTRIEALALKVDARIDAPVACMTPLHEDALELARLGLVLPAVIVIPVCQTVETAPCILSVQGEAVQAYRQAMAKALTVVGRAPVPLEGAGESEFVVFRGGEGLRDQVAILVGKPDLSRPVAVRLHSACLTGDLFGSLKCDCGDQLRETVKFMAAHDGGILLYLDQEGRGNGIANKMRAYKLQSQGYDTYDADEILGFELDQRRFDFAAEMLRQLGVRQVRLMTNNPEKIGALRKSGLDVVADQRVMGRATAENVRYLASKRDRAGHLIDIEAMRAPAQD
jgi:GTP cyclohydrolase II